MNLHKRCILYITVIVLVLPMMFQAAPSRMNVVRRKIQMLEEEPAAGVALNWQDNIACYESLNRSLSEAYTTLDWWNTEPSQQYTGQTSFFKDRRKYEPLKDSTTIIAGVLFTFSNHTLKMSVLFPPLYPEESRVAKLLLTKRDTGELVATRECDIIPNIWKCGFRVDSNDLLADKDQDYAYEIQYQPNHQDNNNEGTIVYTYDGVVPVPRENPRIVGLGCFGTDTKNEKESLVAAVNALKPDLLVLQGDQTYDHNDLEFGFLHLVYMISDMTRSVPTIVQMDDHDYGEPNLWGAQYSREEDSGAGFTKPVCLINEIQDLCMGHNPDPATKETLQNGIGIYYTNYFYGPRLDFAILEARKFKNKLGGDSLLGDEQEEWLQDWCDNDRNRIKVVLTQTPFAMLSTHESRSERSGGGMHEITEPSDDANGGPVEGRRRAMDILSGCSSLILSGDQHLAIGVTYEDYGVTECASPAVVNSIWWRRNEKEVGSKHADLYGNEYTLHAVWNVDYNVSVKYSPHQTIEASESVKQVRADGFLVVDIKNMQATCATHSYHTGILQSPVWEFTVPITLPS